MPTIVYQENPKTHVKYAYESISYWDKDKKAPPVQNADISGALTRRQVRLSKANGNTKSQKLCPDRICRSLWKVSKIRMRRLLY